MRFFTHLLFLLPFWAQASMGYFVPPDGWECIHPQHLSPHVTVGFLGKSSSSFRPSINLAIEQVDVPLTKYVKAVKDLHKKEMRMHWRDLGSFRFQSGKGRLGEISSKSPFGEIKMLQAIYVEDGYAYVLTGAALKEEFTKFSQTFLTAIRSLKIIDNLFSPIENEEKRTRLKQLFEKMETLSNFSEKQLDQEWKNLQEIVEKEYKTMGSHWQFLTLKEGYRKIFLNSPRQKELVE